MHTHILVPPQECDYDGEIRTNKVIPLSFSGINGIYADFEICIDGFYINVCANDSVAMIDNRVAELVCAELGFTGLCCLRICT